MLCSKQNCPTAYVLMYSIESEEIFPVEMISNNHAIDNSTIIVALLDEDRTIMREGNLDINGWTSWLAGFWVQLYWVELSQRFLW